MFFKYIRFLKNPPPLPLVSYPPKKIFYAPLLLFSFFFTYSPFLFLATIVLLSFVFSPLLIPRPFLSSLSSPLIVICVVSPGGELHAKELISWGCLISFILLWLHFIYLFGGFILYFCFYLSLSFFFLLFCLYICFVLPFTLFICFIYTFVLYNLISMLILSLFYVLPALAVLHFLTLYTVYWKCKTYQFFCNPRFCTNVVSLFAFIAVFFIIFTRLFTLGLDTFCTI